MIKLNLGCGSDVRDGWVNADSHPVDASVIQTDIGRDLPFKDESFDMILASHILEHIVHFDRAWIEIHRILKKGGILDVVVPYGFNTDPFHVHYFDLQSVKRLVTYDGVSVVCGSEKGISYKLLDKPRISLLNPLHWHMKRIFGIDFLRVPATSFPSTILPFIKKELRFKLVKT